MVDVHRKIELQEQDDLCYLINNARSRATEKIDLALPPIEGEDALRRRVEELVHEVSRFLSYQCYLLLFPYA
jgi:kinetochor protein Mis14/NSL1